MEYESMWIFAMFDLPVKTTEDRREYTRFRKYFLAEGYMMLQYSISVVHVKVLSHISDALK